MYLVTKEGFEELKKKQKEVEKKLEKLLLTKQEVAIQCGDLWHDNPMLYNLESEERSLRHRLKEISEKIFSAVIIEEKKDKRENNNKKEDTVKIGSCVNLQMENGETKEFVILDPELSDPQKGIISYASPLGKAILGFRVNDVVEYSVGQNKFRVKILSIEGKRNDRK